MNDYNLLTIQNIARVRHNIILNTCDYLKKYSNIECLVLGVSGGADSALVAQLAHEVCEMMKTDYYGRRNIQLIGRSLPIMTNKVDELKRANQVGTLICDDFDTISLDASYEHLAETCGFEGNSKRETARTKAIRYGNIKARIRMVYLYNLAQLNRGMVLSTDNYTEYILGFWTLHGDVGDFGMIQNLWKTEVYIMLDSISRHYVYSEMKELSDTLKSCRDAIPTDGLGITESDLDQFGGINSYEEIDLIFIEMMNNGYSKFIQQGEIPEVLTMFERTKYKRENPFNIPRKNMLEKL